ncbi:putative TetR family transcriptional regulator [Gordonia effusa NBRC 100432]|uniref:Putative TetR family transcriptional regulator n=2 Tax=Gordonia effusa TaxID=263908 RepID=H0R3W5_9ACTN|nr:putative TetR family transcriptional regulator [Gordonia effusa NBRC 100432]
MGDIAAEFGTAKPKLYRYFADKDDLYDAVVERLAGILWSRLATADNHSSITVGEALQSAINEYLSVVVEYPNTFRVLTVAGLASDGGNYAVPVIQQAARRVTTLLESLTDKSHVDSRTVELLAITVAGAGAAVTKWWLGDGGTPMLPASELTTYLQETVQSVVATASSTLGLTIDLNQPLATAFRAVEHAGAQSRG